MKTTNDLTDFKKQKVGLKPDIEMLKNNCEHSKIHSQKLYISKSLKKFSRETKADAKCIILRIICP